MAYEFTFSYLFWRIPLFSRQAKVSLAVTLLQLGPIKQENKVEEVKKEAPKVEAKAEKPTSEKK